MGKTKVIGPKINSKDLGAVSLGVKSYALASRNRN
jgi:hypothetical protein